MPLEFYLIILIFINSIFKNRLKKNQMNYLDSMKQWLCSIKNLCCCFNDIKILNLEKAVSRGGIRHHANFRLQCK